MAMIDYGTLVKKNGNLVNEGIMFMDKSDMGVVPVEDAYKDVSDAYSREPIREDYFAYVGTRI